MLCGVRNDLHPSLEGLRIVSIAGLYAKKERGKCLSLFLGQRGTGTNPSKSDLPVAGQWRGIILHSSILLIWGREVIALGVF